MPSPAKRSTNLNKKHLLENVLKRNVSQTRLISKCCKLLLNSSFISKEPDSIKIINKEDIMPDWVKLAHALDDQINKPH